MNIAFKTNKTNSGRDVIMGNKPKAKILSDEESKLSDGLENLVAELGTAQDKRTHSRFVNNNSLSMDKEELSAMYRTEWVAGKIVDIIPDDMTREWREFSGDIDPTIVKQLTDEEKRIDLVGQFNLAHKWARLYGTAYIVISVDDGLLPDKPLDISKIKKGKLRHIKAIDRYRLFPADTTPINDPMDINFGMPEYYRFNETSVRIHHSRVLRFDGVRLPYDDFRQNNYHSDSVLCRLYDTLTNFVTTANGASSMVYETNVDIMKVKGLMNYMSSAEGTSLVRKRFALANALKSFNNMLLMDSEEEYQNKTNTFAGLPDLLDKFSLFLGAASDIPATRLLGSSASGFNATGEGDLKNYYDTVRSAQIRDYKPKLDFFDRIMGASLGINEEELDYIFVSLFQMTPKEEADLQFTNAQRDAIYLDRDVVPAHTIAKELKQSSTYTNIEDEYIEELEGMEDEPEPDTDDDIITAKPEDEEGAEEESSSGEES